MNDFQVLIKRLDPELPLATSIQKVEMLVRISSLASISLLAPGERALVPTGISIALPDGYVALVHPRSGLSDQTWSHNGQCSRNSRCRITVVNCSAS